MLLTNPITLQINNQQITISKLSPMILDDTARKIVLVRPLPFLAAMVLWKNEEYDKIGDYTQAQVDEKILELLGTSPQEKLQSLVLN